MDVTFKTAALAALCNSERRLAERFGADVGRTVACRLLDIAAVEAADLDRLPAATVSTHGSGETIVTFGDVVVIRGIVGSSDSTSSPVGTEGDFITITSVDTREDKK